MSAATTPNLSPSIKSQIAVLAGLFLLVLVLHLPIFWRSVMDWDESLYLLMAEQWQAGHLPYTTIWDNKPIGIYAIFLVFIDIFKNHLFAIRFATVIFTALTAFAVFRITNTCVAGRKYQFFWSVAAAVIFVIGALSNDGLSANTEIFMACFTSYAMVVAISAHAVSRPIFWKGGLCGLLIGCAIMTKYVAVFEVPAVIFGMMGSAPTLNPKKRYEMLIGALIGVLVPVTFAITLYCNAGISDVWWNDSVASNFVRVAAHVPQPNLLLVADEHLKRWLGFYLAPLILLFIGWRSANISLRHFLIIWFIGGGIGVYSARSFFDHYFLQLLPVMSIMTICCLARLCYQLKIIYACTMFTPIYSGWMSIQNAAAPVVTVNRMQIQFHADTTAKISSDLRANLQPGQIVYVFDDQPIIYSLISQTPPTKYVLPSVLTTHFLASVAHVDSVAEVKRILELSPEFIVRSRYPASTPPNRNEVIYRLVNDRLATHYTLWKQYDVSYIYRLN